MLSHDHLSKLEYKAAQMAVEEKKFIGTYVSTRIDWIGALKNKKWQTEEEKELLFQWFLNFSTCLGFIDTLRNCLDVYSSNPLDRAQREKDVVNQISVSWTEGEVEFSTVSELKRYLKEIVYNKHKELTHYGRYKNEIDKIKSIGPIFDTQLFVPFKNGIDILSQSMDIPEDCSWILSIDEAEFLEPMHQRIINSFLRTATDNLYFKITTMPYTYTLETNTLNPLDEGHDFEYVYLGSDPIFYRRDFADKLFSKRANNSPKFKGLTITELLGKSELLSREAKDWSQESKFMELLEKYATTETINKGIQLSNSPKKFSDQIGRKIHGALLLRHALETQTGHQKLDIYSGDLLAIRCGDGNPRRLIRIFNRLLLKSKKTRDNKYIISKQAQNQIMNDISYNSLVLTQSEERIGPILFDLLKRIGEYTGNKIIYDKLSTEQVSSIIVDNSVDEILWECIKRAVDLSLLYPNVNPNNPDQTPSKEGVFHIAYVLAPYFKLLPRRGRSQKLSTILQYNKGQSNLKDFIGDKK